MQKSMEQLMGMWNGSPVRLLDVYRQQVEPGETFRFGRVADEAFVVISRGTGSLTMDGMTHAFNGAYVIHVSRQTDFVLAAEQDVELYGIGYAFRSPRSFSEDLLTSLTFMPSDIWALKRSLERLLEQWQRFGVLDQLRLTAYLYECIHLIFQANSYTSETPTDERIQRALRYMLEQITHTTHLPACAEVAGCGARRLTQLFRERFERSPMQVFTQLRMQQAAQHLLETKSTLQQIAERIGYANAYSFSRQFKQSYGISPEHYRKCPTALVYKNETPSKIAETRLRQDLQIAQHQPSTNTPAPAAPNIRIAEPTRMVSSVMGKIEVPSRPQRIVTDWSIGHLLALDTPPIGAPSTLVNTGKLLDAYWDIAPHDIGRHNQISYTRMLELEPDLILTWNRAAYASYSRIAPTLVFEADHYRNMEEEIRTLGDWIGRKREAEAWIRQTSIRTYQLRRRLAERFAKPTSFTLVDPYWYGAEVTLIGNTPYRGGKAVYDRLNLPLPASLRHSLIGSQQGSIRVSSAELESKLGEWVLVMSYEDSYGLTSAPGWDLENVAQRHRIIDLPWERYFQSDPLSSLLQAEELVKLLDRPFSPC